MRVLIVSDIHANPWALRAVEAAAGPVDHVLCLGDSVSYGTQPREVIAWLREHEAITIRGNHDQAAAFNVHPRASPAKAALALALRDWTRSQLTPSDFAWLARLPVELTWEMAGIRFGMVHGTPIDPLYDYRLQPGVREDLLPVLLTGVRADLLLLGHTHLPLKLQYRNLTLLNPGSAGQPLDGDPRAAFALWEDGRLEHRRAAYDAAPLLASLAQLPVPSELRSELAQVIQQGRIQ